MWLRSLRGRKFDALAACVRRGGTFTAAEVGVHQVTMKGLADMGLLEVARNGSTYPVRSKRYRVPSGVAVRFGRMGYAGGISLK